MTRNVLVFLSTFVAGALLALIARAAMHDPHAGREPQPQGGGDYAPLVSNPLAPADSSHTADPHANHGADGTGADAQRAQNAPAAVTEKLASTGTAKAGSPVNTVCAICGMPVDPKLPTVQYEGKTIGFGCKMCPPKFKADPDRYGPIYLKNEVVKR